MCSTVDRLLSWFGVLPIAILVLLADLTTAGSTKPKPGRGQGSASVESCKQFKDDIGWTNCFRGKVGVKKHQPFLETGRVSIGCVAKVNGTEKKTAYCNLYGYSKKQLS